MARPPASPLRGLLGALQRYHRALACTLGVGDGDEIAVLELLDESVYLTPSVIAAHLGVRTSTTTGLLDRLENAGHIRRVPNPLDRRSVNIALTVTGRQAAAWLRRAHIDQLRTLTPDQDARTPELIDRIRHALTQPLQAPAPNEPLPPRDPSGRHDRPR